MDRRTFLRAVPSALFAATPRVAAQPNPKTRRIGVLGVGTANAAPLATSLRDLGWVEGNNLVIEPRASDDGGRRLPALAADLVQLNVEVIVSFGTLASLAAKDATTIIPIVTTSGDPVRLGLVSNPSRPGGNITGWNTMAFELAAKRLELLRELLPDAVRVAEFVDPADYYQRLTRAEYEERFRVLRMQPILLEVTSPEEVDGAFAAMVRQRAHALIVRIEPVLNYKLNGDRILRLAVQHALPTMLNNGQLVAAGGLMSYAPAGTALFHGVAALVDKILNGATPADLPIGQPTKFQMLINLKTARALRLTVPSSLLVRADEVIQ